MVCKYMKFNTLLFFFLYNRDIILNKEPDMFYANTCTQLMEILTEANYAFMPSSFDVS